MTFSPVKHLNNPFYKTCFALFKQVKFKQPVACPKKMNC